MKHIIKPGTKFTATCYECGCYFSYEKEDLIYGTYRYECWSWVTCPQCGHKIETDYTYGNVAETKE